MMCLFRFLSIVVLGFISLAFVDVASLASAQEATANLSADTAQALTAQALTAQALSRLAHSYSTRNPTLAMQYARQALETALARRDSLGYAEALRTVGVLFRNQDAYDSALHYESAAKALFERLGNKRGIAETLLNLGGVYQSRSEYSTALDYYLQALKTFEELGDESGRARTLAGIGIIYRMKANYPKAMEYQRQALSIRKKLGDQGALAHSWRNIGGVYESLHYSDSALAAYLGALAVFRQCADTQGIALSLSSVGSAYFGAGEGEKALKYYFAALPLQERLGDKRGKALLLNAIAAVFASRSSHEQAIIYADKARSIADSIGAWSENRDAYKLLADAHSALGNTASAFECYKRYIVFKDSVSNVQSVQKLAALQYNYDLAQKDRELAALQHERDLEAVRLRNLRVGLVLGTLAFLTIIALIANGYRLKKKSAEMLQHQNIEIRQQQMLLEAQAGQIQEANSSLEQTNILLEERNTTLTELNTEKNEFLGIAAHDLKNPLNAILLSTELIPEYLERELNVAAKVQEITDSISVAANTMLSIIKNLLDVNRFETGVYSLAAESVEIVPILAVLLDRYTWAAEQKQIRLVVAPYPYDIMVKGDTQAIEQVLDNLLSNAVKYSPHGKNVFVDLSCVDVPRADNDQTSPQTDGQTTSVVRIAVRDEGPGLSDEDKSKLFGKFARLSAQPTGGEHSTGLGLSIVKKMVEAMRGRVWCESELGFGATFVVELPADNQSQL